MLRNDAGCWYSANEAEVAIPASIYLYTIYAYGFNQFKAVFGKMVKVRKNGFRKQNRQRGRSDSADAVGI